MGAEASLARSWEWGNDEKTLLQFGSFCKPVREKWTGVMLQTEHHGRLGREFRYAPRHIDSARDITVGRNGKWDGSQQCGMISCPVPSHGKGKGDRNPSVSVRGGHSGILVKCFAGCSALDILAALEADGWNVRSEARQAERQYRPPTERPQPLVPVSDNSEIARSTWKRAAPVFGTLGQIYLEHRGCCPAQTTLRFLAATDRAPAMMVAPFGIPDEPAPGVLMMPPHRVRAIHRTFLAPDGRGRIAKKMLGPTSGAPIVLAPPNDGMGLIIAEGIEDALSGHLATGLGAWAAGSAGHMPKLADAVPDYIECVTILADPDPVGQRASADLGRALRGRGIEAVVTSLSVGDAR